MTKPFAKELLTASRKKMTYANIRKDKVKKILLNGSFVSVVCDYNYTGDDEWDTANENGKGICNNEYAKNHLPNLINADTKCFVTLKEPNRLRIMVTYTHTYSVYVPDFVTEEPTHNYYINIFGDTQTHKHKLLMRGYTFSESRQTWFKTSDTLHNAQSIYNHSIEWFTNIGIQFSLTDNKGNVITLEFEPQNDKVYYCYNCDEEWDMNHLGGLIPGFSKRHFKQEYWLQVKQSNCCPACDEYQTNWKFIDCEMQIEKPTA